MKIETIYLRAGRPDDQRRMLQAGGTDLPAVIISHGFMASLFRLHAEGD